MTSPKSLPTPFYLEMSESKAITVAELDLKDFFHKVREVGFLCW